MALVGSLSGSYGLVGVSGTMEPAVDNAYSMGTSSKKWSKVIATALSGAHTNLSDGRSFLVAGSNITVTSASDGQITIASTGGGGGTSYFDSTTAGSIFTTGSAAFRGGESAVDAPSDKGADVFFYVSGTTNGSQTALFGGGLVASASIKVVGAGGALQGYISTAGVISGSGDLQTGGNFTLAGGATITGSVVTNGSLTVGGSAITATAPTTINLGNTAATVNVGQTGTGNALNVRGNLDVDGTADIAGTVTLSGNGQNVTHSGTGNLTIASTGGNVLIEGTTFNGNDVTIPGNLTVNGTVVSIETTNLKVKDSVVLIASGAASSNTKSALAFASGSSISNASLIFGSLGGADTLAAARMDVQDGTIAGASLSYTDLVPVRASKFEIGGVNAYLTSSDGTSFVLSGTSGTSKIGSVTGKGISFETNNTQLAIIKDSGSDTFFGGDGSSGARGLILSGAFLSLDYGGGGNGIQMSQQGLAFARMQWNSGGSTATLATAAPGSNLVVGTTGAGSTTISGSTINAIYGSTGFNFSRDGTSAVKLSGPATAPAFVAQQTNAVLRIATNGGGSDQVILSGSALQINNGAPGITVQRDGSAVLTVFGVSGSSTTIDNALGVPTANLFGGGSVTALKIASGSSARTEIGGLTGQTYLYSDIFLGTGNLIGAPGSGANTLSLISSGNVVAKLDVNADAVGHKFIVQNAAGTSMFTAGEDGNAEVSGSFVVSGSTLSTVSTTFSLLNTTATTINFAGGASTLLTLGNTSGNTWISGSVKMPGSVVLGNDYTQTVEFKSKVTGSIVPNADITYDLGSPSFRWANMYTGDLHLRNDRGSWTIIEESDFLSITNNLNGKRYKFVLEEL